MTVPPAVEARVQSHIPVLLEEVITGLNIRPDGIYIDCTFGRGGHSRAILKELNADGRLLAFDKDPDAINSADEQLRTDRRFSLFHGSYTMLREVVERNNMLQKIDGVLFDLGVSSPQLDDAGRGFSFRLDGPLDMRMNTQAGITAAQWVNSARESELSDVIKIYGEERYARRIARAIVLARTEHPLQTTRQLADLIVQAVPTQERDKHPATRTFQAIRIFINHELEELEHVLKQALFVLRTGGRLVVISFHSLEDRIVKRFMRDQARGDRYPEGVPVTQNQLSPALKIIGKPVYPGEREIASNPRARSAVLRIAERMAA